MVAMSAVSAPLGPGGRLSRSRTSASWAKLFSVMEPLLPLLLEVDIVTAPEDGNALTRHEKSLSGHGQTHYDAHWMDRANGPPNGITTRAYELRSPFRPRGLGLNGTTVPSASFCAAIRDRVASPLRPSGLFTPPF